MKIGILYAHSLNYTNTILILGTTFKTASILQAGVLEIFL